MPFLNKGIRMEDHDIRRQALRRQRSMGRDQEFVKMKDQAYGDVFLTHLGVSAKAA
ncbi:uncharacterized protein G2W53_021579 [Senna tora]|uniref:Uncharacterized protein n=1 Tax=Senna tora TaxID=362788 RepID=A0A834TM55_9FABA|nr:uncharacterized protein G2W53_021579 [Senna tora]